VEGRSLNRLPGVTKVVVREGIADCMGMRLAPPADQRDGAGHLAAFGMAGHDVLHASSRAFDM